MRMTGGLHRNGRKHKNWGKIVDYADAEYVCILALMEFSGLLRFRQLISNSVSERALFLGIERDVSLAVSFLANEERMWKNIPFSNSNTLPMTVIECNARNNFRGR